MKKTKSISVMILIATSTFILGNLVAKSVELQGKYNESSNTLTIEGREPLEVNVVEILGQNQIHGKRYGDPILVEGKIEGTTPKGPQEVTIENIPTVQLLSSSKVVVMNKLNTASTRQQWEYKAIPAVSDAEQAKEASEMINELGKENWELVSASNGVLYFKRPTF